MIPSWQGTISAFQEGNLQGNVWGTWRRRKGRGGRVRVVTAVFSFGWYANLGNRSEIQSLVYLSVPTTHHRTRHVNPSTCPQYVYLTPFARNNPPANPNRRIVPSHSALLAHPIKNPGATHVQPPCTCLPLPFYIFASGGPVICRNVIQGPPSSIIPRKCQS
jgi:hypothetical protein